MSAKQTACSRFKKRRLFSLIVLLIPIVASCNGRSQLSIQIPEEIASSYYTQYLKPLLVDGYLRVPKNQTGIDLLKKNLEIQALVVRISDENRLNQITFDAGDGKPYQRKYLEFDANGNYSIKTDPATMVASPEISLLAYQMGKEWDSEIRVPAISEGFENRNINYVRTLNGAFREVYAMLDKDCLFPDLTR